MASKRDGVSFFLEELDANRQRVTETAAKLPQATGFLPWITRINTAIMARTNKMWINPPNVYELTIPKSQRINKRAAIVQSIESSFPASDTLGTLENKPESKRPTSGEFPKV